MKKRFKRTLKLVKELIPKNMIIYDLGRSNELSKIMQLNGYTVYNNIGFADFDFTRTEITSISTQSKGMNSPKITTSFEVFEHLLNPFEVLRAIKTPKMLCTVPLKVWFSPAYWGKHDKNRHFHEFEERQFLWLLDKTGWEVVKKGKWKLTDKIGIRPLLRLFWPSYLWVLAKRKI